MKNKFSGFLLWALFGTSALMARTSQDINVDEPKLVTLAELAQAIETGMPLDQFRNIVVECPQGSELPISMTVRGDTLSLEPNLLTLKLLKPCYIKAGKGPLKFSTDLKKWQDFSEFFTGKAAAALEFQNQMTKIKLELDLNQQKNRWEAPFAGLKEPRCKNKVYIHNSYHTDYYQRPLAEYPTPKLDPVEQKTETKSRWW